MRVLWHILRNKEQPCGAASYMKMSLELLQMQQTRKLMLPRVSASVRERPA